MDSQDIRLDRWLWAARFFKTRAIAQKAVAGGQVHVNGQRCKASRTVRPGDRLDITRGEECFEVEVIALLARRGPASLAQTLYAETTRSVAARQSRQELKRDLAGNQPPRARPDKRDRRRLIGLVRNA